MSKTSTLSFHPNGTVTGLWTELIDLHQLGEVQIERASNIEFNNATHRWDVEIKGEVVFSDPSRDCCLEWEHDYFERLILS